MANIVFADSDSSVPGELGRVLTDEGHQVTVQDSDHLGSADVVFCNGDGANYTLLLARMRCLWPDLPVVIVTRLPDSDKWLDALEAGASDYCSAPFERIQVRWILSAVLDHHTPVRKPSPLAASHAVQSVA